MIARWSIRAQLAALVAAVALPLLGAGAYSTWRAFAEEKRDAQTAAVALADLAASNTAQFLHSAETLAIRLASAPGAQALDPRRCPGDWPGIVARTPSIVNIATVDLAGRFVCSAPSPIVATTPRVTPERSPWFREFAATRGFVVGDLQMGGVTLRPVSILGYPLRDRGGAVRAALTLTVDVGRFREPWQALALPEGTVITIVDGAGVVIARSLGAERWLGRSVGATALRGAIRLGTDTMFEGLGLDSLPRLYGAVPVARTGWTVIVGVPRARAYAKARSAALRTVLVGAVVVSLVLALALAIAQAIGRPIRELGAAFAGAATGEVPRVAETGPPELRALATAYNRMVEQRTRAEADAEAARQRVLTLASLAPVGIFRTDAEDRVSFANEQFRRITGIGAHADGGAIGPTVHPADRERVVAAWRNAVRSGAAFRAEFRFRHADGTVLWAQGEAIPELATDGSTAGMIGTLVDITDQVRTASDLNVAYARVRSLLAQLETTRERERAHIARELHDQLGQLFVALRMDIGSLEQTLTELAPDARARIAAMREVVDRGVQDVRRLSRELRPSVLDDLGLVPALRWLTDDFRERSGVPCEVDLPERPADADADRATAVFRIMQEALTNIGRHAAARHVKVVLTADDGLLQASVTDDGKGFDVDASATRVSYGLLGMQERAVALGGYVAVYSAPGRGTTVALEIPARGPAAREGPGAPA